MSPNSISVLVGNSEAITIQAQYDDGSHVDVSEQAEYTSSDSEIASVSSTGEVTGVSEGIVEISVVYEGIGVASVSVEVEEEENDDE